MNGLSKRACVLIAVLMAAAGVAVAVVLLTRGGPESALAKGPAGVVASGSFKSVGWATSGTATVVRDGDGHLRLRLSKSFRTREAPELYVYLARFEGEHRTMWKQVGELKSAYGSQSYTLPTAAGPGVTVSIYCAKCNKEWGVAALRAAGTPA
jgi:hypothetical protein